MSANQSNSPANETAALYYHYAGLTDTGMVRDHNEDAYKLPSDTDAATRATKGHLYVLADGMGGHQKGEIASAITIEIVNNAYYTAVIGIDEAQPEHGIITALAQAIEKANLEVMDATQGGGTTVVAAVLHHDTLIAMNVGDSRAYLLRDNELHRLSRDHSLVSRLVEMGKITEEEALSHPRRNVLYQALGQGSDVDIHIVQEKLQLGDMVILCSDGLWGEVGDQTITEVLSQNENPRQAIKTLVDLANHTGGPDNITAIVIQVSDREASDEGYGSETQSPAPLTSKDDDTQPSMPVMTPRFNKPNTLPEYGDWVD